MYMVYRMYTVLYIAALLCLLCAALILHPHHRQSIAFMVESTNTRINARDMNTLTAMYSQFRCTFSLFPITTKGRLQNSTLEPGSLPPCEINLKIS